MAQEKREVNILGKIANLAAHGEVVDIDGDYVIAVANEGVVEYLLNGSFKQIPHFSAHFVANKTEMTLRSKSDVGHNVFIQFLIVGDEKSLRKTYSLELRGYQFVTDGFAVVWPLLLTAEYLENRCKGEA